MSKEQNTTAAPTDPMLERLDQIAKSLSSMEKRLAKVESTDKKDRKIEFGRPLDMQGELEEIHIDLAPCGGNSIRINGFDFFHGNTYKVTKDVAATMYEIMGRTWAHENEIRGTNANEYRRHQERRLGMR